MSKKITRRQALARTSIALGGALITGLSPTLVRAVTGSATGTTTDAATGSATGPAGASQTGPEKRPNILLLLADDWSWQGAEAVDRLGLRMPTLARLQRDGISFDNAFSASPSSTAARGAILTGRFPWRLEEGANLDSILPRHFPLYTELLEKSGYAVGLTGKGWGPGQLDPVGRKRNPAGDAYPDFNTFLDHRPAGQPFCFWFGAADPHRPFKAGAGIKSGIDPATIEVPPYLPDTPEVRSDLADYRHALERFDLEAGQLLERLERDGLLDNTLVIMAGDNGWPFPRAKANLYDAGSHVPLVAMYPGKIGAGRVTKALVSTIDLAATFLDVAGVRKPTSMDARTLMPLMQNGGEGPRRFVLTGRERHMDGGAAPRQAYPARAIRTTQYLYIRNIYPDRWPAGMPARRAVTPEELDLNTYAAFADIDPGPTKTALVLGRGDPKIEPLLELATAKRPSMELYDVKSDPYQMTNLAADPKLRNVVAQLDKELMAELTRTGDPRMGKAGDVFDGYPPYSEPGLGRPVNL